MKILIFANNDVGLYKFRKELIAELLKDNEVYISLPNGDFIEKLVSIGCQYIETNVDRRGVNPLKDITLYKSYKSILKSIKPDLVITYTIKPNIYGGYACSKLNIPYAVNITGLGTSFEKDGILKKLVKTMYRVALKRAKVVFFENSANRDLFVNENIVSLDKTCLLNGAGVNTEEFSYLDYPTDDSVIRFLFIGRVMKEKGIDELLAATKMIVDEGFNCITDIVGPYEEDYNDILFQYENDGYIKYYGFQSDVRPFIKNCHCFVLPSYHEGMANTNLECASSGRPVITSNIPGCKEAVINQISGFLIEIKNIDELYNSMKRIVDMSNEEKRLMGKKGRNLMIELFSKQNIINDTIASINNIMN